MTFPRVHAVLLIGALVPVLTAVGQVQTTASPVIRVETIRGTAKTDSAKAIAGAEVIATMAPNREIFRTTTDSSGQFSLTVDKGTGDYLLYIAATDRTPFRRRLQRAGADSVFVVNAVLASNIQTLAPVRTVAQRPRPPRNDDALVQTGASASSFGGVHGALGPDQAGDANAMALTMPGFSLTPNGGVSVYGLDPSQNLVTLNGMAFEGGGLPRDLPVSTSVASSLYDPTRGGFGGGLIALEIRPGSQLPRRSAHLALDLPQLQIADPATRALGQRYGRGDLSFSSTGEMVPDLWVYTAGFQASQRMSSAPSVFDRSSAAFNRLGIAEDSATRFLDIVNRYGIPSVGGIPGSYLNRSISTAFRLDRAAAGMFGLAMDTRPRWGVVGSLRYSGEAPLSAVVTAPLAHGGERNSVLGSLQLSYSKYFGKGAYWLDEARSSVSINRSTTDRYLDLPDGRVRVSSVVAGGTNGIASLQFGGNAGLDARSTSWTWQGTNELSFTPNKLITHRFKLAANALIDHYDQSAASNTLGTFTFASLADFDANVPSSFTRTLFAPNRIGGSWSTSLALADYWTKSPDLQIIWGPRVELNGYTRAPGYNPAIQQLFGVNTSETPVMAHVSPRIGFNWFYGGARNSQRGSASSAALGSLTAIPRGVVRGGIGEFRSRPSGTLMSEPGVSTGLAGTTIERLSCVGAAAPVPDWAAYANPAAIPTTCATGAPGVFTDIAPTIRVVDPAFAAARSWRGNLAWQSAYRSTTFWLDASYSLNLNQPGFVDLNFAGSPKFSLNGEGRPVFVNESSIVPATGLLSATDSRVTTTYGRVLSQVSDLRSETKQVTLFLQPYIPRKMSQWIFKGGYTWSDSRTQTRGFGGTTAGDPRTTQWARGYAPKHQFTWQAGYGLAKVNAAFTMSGNVASGYPFTPVVSGDINGDGASNDRAFIVTAAESPPLAAQTNILLGGLPGRVRDCVMRQAGRIANENSCTGPWRAGLNARLDYRRALPYTSRHVNMSLNFANPLTGLDLLLHGSDRLRGWGAPSFPDNALYQVTAYDPGNHRFIYEVNPRFGSARPGATGLMNPFRITLDFTFTLDGNTQLKTAELYVRPPRGSGLQRATADTIYRRLTGLGTPAYAPLGIAALSDSLLLSIDQVRALQAAVTAARAADEATMRSIASELAAMPPETPPQVVSRLLQEKRSPLFQSNRWTATIKGILTPAQIRLLPDNYLRSMPDLLKP